MVQSFSTPKLDVERFQKELTDETREAAQRDMLGQSETSVQETPSFVQESFQKLIEELDTIESKEAYETATMLCPEYVNGKKFRLMFLRATRFNIPETASKIVEYWDAKVHLFGADRAFHKLSIHDMHDEDRVALERGGFRALSGRDEHGRAILFSHRRYWDLRTTHRNSNVRLLWLVVHDLLEDEDVQWNGMHFFISNGFNTLIDPMSHDSKLDRLLHRYAGCLPIHVPGFHHFMEFRTLKILIDSMFFAVDSRFKERYKVYPFHTEDEREATKEKLESYGITLDCIPVELGGNLEFDHTAWLMGRENTVTHDDDS